MRSRSLQLRSGCVTRVNSNAKRMRYVPVIAVLANERLHFGEDLLKQAQMLILASDRLQVIAAFHFEFALQVFDVLVERAQLTSKQTSTVR